MKKKTTWVKKIEFLFANKPSERMLKITLSNNYVIFAGATYDSWVKSDGIDNAKAAQAVINQYSDWLRNLVD